MTADALHRMSCLLPAPLLLVAGAAALFLVPQLVRRPVSVARLAIEVFGIPAAAVALVWLAWLVLWMIEQRW